MFAWAKVLGLYPLVDYLREICELVRPDIPQWLVFSAPNTFWIFSFGMFMTFLWKDADIWIAYAWTAVLCLIGIVSEFMQLCEVLPGVFDVVDVIAYLIGFFGLLIARGDFLES